ncbi:MAG: response regulator [Gemmatimonadetes bacterium]|nr:response regulator [Gemmatimonadota bacterium]
MAVYSEAGLGTSFKLYLPPAEENAGEAPTPAEDEAHGARGTETVLVVEDDDAVRRSARRALASRGYTVLEAASGDAALRLLREHGGTLDAVLTDVVMPGMSGRELADSLLEIRARVPVIFMSGYTSDIILRRRIREGEWILEKPFSARQLAELVRRVLDGRTGVPQR